MSTEEPEGIHGRRVRHGKGYESIRREALQDPALSFKALGVLCYLLSLPDTWKTNSARLGIARTGKEGVTAVRSALRELEDAGYLKRERVHLGAGKWRWTWEYTDNPDLLSQPDDGFPIIRFPKDGPPKDGPPPHIRDLGCRGSRSRDQEESKDMATAGAVTAHLDQPGLFEDPPPSSRPEVEVNIHGHKRQKIAWSTPKPPEQYDLEQLWATFWRCYPKKVKRLTARGAWDKAITKADPRDLIDAAAAYAKQQADPWLAQFTKHPTTWLNGGCWDDEPERPPTNGNGRGPHVPYRNPTDPTAYEGPLR